MDTLVQDARFAARMLSKSPGFTLVAVLSLALGIGANTAIFGLVNTLLLRPLPVTEPERMVWVWGTFSMGENARVSGPDLLDYRERTRTFEHLAAHAEISYNLTGTGEPEFVNGAIVTANYFQALGVAPALGRAFLPEEEDVRRPEVAILSHGLWQRRFGADPSVIGRPVMVDGKGVTVVGVMPAGFQFPSGVDLWVPVPFQFGELGLRKAHFLRPIGRLAPGATLAQAQAEMNVIAADLEAAYPATNTGWGLRLSPFHEEVVGDIRTPLLVLLGAVGFVLLIACANVANLLMARATSRRREIAIRAAMGASRLRIVRQLLTESLVLSVAAGALGLLVTSWATDLLATQLPADATSLFPGAVSYGIDARVVGFALAVSIATGLLFGCAPALQVSRPDLNESLKDGGHGGGGRRARLRGALVVSEVALSLALLVGAGLLVRSFLALQSVDPGFDPSGLLTLRLALPMPEYREPERRTAFFEQVLDRLRSMPGVEAAGLTSRLPLAGQHGDTYFTVEGRPPDDPNDRPVANFRMVSHDYFDTMRVKLLAGRQFTPQEASRADRVVIVTEAMARTYLPGEDPVGRRLVIDAGQPTAFEIVGVIADVRHYSLAVEPMAEMYIPSLEFPVTNLVLRTSGDPMRLAAAVGAEIRQVDPNQPVTDVRTMEQLRSSSVTQQRFNMALFGVFAVVALLLAVLGIYGVMAYTVAQRTHEIGIRLALGARSGDVLRLVLRQGIGLALAGIAAGLAASVALTRVMASLLFGVSATDAATFAGVALLLGAVALLACYIPARRATKVDPIEALRYE